MDRKRSRPNRPTIRKVCPLPSKNQPPSKQRCFFVVETKRVVPVSRSAFSPTGGPASGLFSNSSGVAPSPAPTPTPTPTPVPPTPCVIPSLIADCFDSCVGGPIDQGSPGPVCGWTFVTPFGPKGGQVSFTPLMSLETLGGNSDSPAAAKGLLSALVGVTNISIQYTFTEFPGSAGSGLSRYDFYLTDTGPVNALDIFLDDTGSVFITLGPGAGADAYFGTWTPNNGTHKVDLSVDGAMVPTLFIDDVAIPLAFLGTGFSFSGIPPSNVFMPTALRGTAVSAATVSSIFVTNGVFPPSTVYCCP